MENHTLFSARFMNSDLSIIEAKWTPNDKPEGQKTLQIIQNDPKEHALRKLLEHCTMEDIWKTTKTYNRDVNRLYRNYVKKIAAEEGIASFEPITKKTDINVANLGTIFANINSVLFNEYYDDEKHKQALFNLKLNLFELPQIKNSDLRALKAQLRKANTPREIYRVALEFFD